jgi:hypothetical protein
MDKAGIMHQIVSISLTHIVEDGQHWAHAHGLGGEEKTGTLFSESHAEEVYALENREAEERALAGEGGVAHQRSQCPTMMPT